MKNNTKKIINKNLAAAKSMTFDLFIKSLDLLNPNVWINPEIAKTTLTNLGITFLKGRLQKMFDEINHEKLKDRINEDVLNSEKTTHSILELVSFLSKKNPDTETWEAAKTIFKKTLLKDTTEQERSALYDLLIITMQLNGSEIRILAGAYQIIRTTEEKDKNVHNVRWWADKVKDNIGFYTSDQVLRYEDNLIQQKLISPRENIAGRTSSSTWDVQGGTHAHRLTPLGLKLAELLSKDYADQ